MLGENAINDLISDIVKNLDQISRQCLACRKCITKSFIFLCFIFDGYNSPWKFKHLLMAISIK